MSRRNRVGILTGWLTASLFVLVGAAVIAARVVTGKGFSVAGGLVTILIGIFLGGVAWSASRSQKKGA